VQALAAPGGVPLWVSDVLPGSTHDVTAARELVLPQARPCAGNTFLSRAIEDRFGKAEPNLPVVGTDRSPAHRTSLFVHILTLAHRA
jgi:hypothetical protein